MGLALPVAAAAITAPPPPTARAAATRPTAPLLMRLPRTPGLIVNDAPPLVREAIQYAACAARGLGPCAAPSVRCSSRSSSRSNSTSPLAGFIRQEKRGGWRMYPFCAPGRAASRPLPPGARLGPERATCYTPFVAVRCATRPLWNVQGDCPGERKH